LTTATTVFKTCDNRLLTLGSFLVINKNTSAMT
jgi:hypothetical protein